MTITSHQWVNRTDKLGNVEIDLILEGTDEFHYRVSKSFKVNFDYASVNDAFLEARAQEEIALVESENP